MEDDKRNDSVNGGNIEGAARWDRRDCEEEGDMLSSSVASSGEVAGSAPRSVVNMSYSGESKGSRNGISIADRLAESLLGGDCDLLLQQSESESNFLQWLQALDMQAIGACRADERMKPLLKANASGVAEDRILTYLSEHFEAAEVGLLARCLCIPLVSIRVGKIIKRGTTLCPTSSRGTLNVALLPSSDLRITFVGDDGQAERIATVNCISEVSLVAIEEIPAETSGRSFSIRVPEVEVFYFWISEKSKLLGKELLSKMKDLLNRKPTLASLTGINESRLACFATHLRTYLLGSNSINKGSSTTASSTSILLDAISDAYEPGRSTRSSLVSAKHSRYRHNGSQPLKTQTLYQGSLSPRSNSFKEGGLTRSLSSLRSASREKLKPRRGDIHLSVCSSGTTSISTTESYPSENGKTPTLPEVTESNSVSALTFLESIRTVSLPPILSAASKRSPVGSLLSPYYCWCPPCTSLSTISTQLPLLPLEAMPFSLPTLSQLLPPTRPGFLTEPVTLPLSLADVPPLDFPSSLVSKQSSQQIATFTPLMCDPIVHIPVIDVCSSGQGYLVSAGPSAIPSLMIPETESMVEKGARETLRLLLSSSSSQSQPNSSLIGILPLPSVLNVEDGPSMLMTGSRGFYTGSSDVDAIANGIAAVNLVSLSERSISFDKLHTGSNSVSMDHHSQVTSGDGIEGSGVGGNETSFSYEEENY